MPDSLPAPEAQRSTIQQQIAQRGDMHAGSITTTGDLSGNPRFLIFTSMSRTKFSPGLVLGVGPGRLRAAAVPPRLQKQGPHSNGPLVPTPPTGYPDQLLHIIEQPGAPHVAPAQVPMQAPDDVRATVDMCPTAMIPRHRAMRAAVGDLQHPSATAAAQ
jgi:hypothetical protein